MHLPSSTTMCCGLARRSMCRTSGESPIAFNGSRGWTASRTLTKCDSSRLGGMRTVRLGIVGAGRVVTTRHLPALARIPEVQVQAIWSRVPAHAEQVAQQFNIPRVAQEWQEVVAASEIDAV